MFGSDSKWPHVVNLVNGIIGVSVLAMPFCLQKFGLILGLLLLVCSTVLNRITCNLLVQGAFICNCQTYEQYAFRVFGPVGKSFVEICMILYTKATLIAFFVVIGGLGQSVLLPVVSENAYMHSEIVTNFRTIFTVLFALTVVLPLCLLKSIRSLSLISSLAVLFYGFLIFCLFCNSIPNIVSVTTWSEVNYWKWDGVLQCLPIFFTSLSCQTQLFVISSQIPDSKPYKMDAIISSAVTICSVVYFSVGVFGYTGFYHKGVIPGDVMLLLEGFVAQIVKLGFLFSVAVSYPIMIFPCRLAIYSMINGSRRSKSSAVLPLEHMECDTHIPDVHLKLITLFLIASNLIVAIMFPNMELILAVSGSLVGSLICFIIPAALFLKCSRMGIISGSKISHSASNFHAEISRLVGLIVLVFCTYVTISHHQYRDIGNKAGELKTSTRQEVTTYTTYLLLNRSLKSE